MPVVLVAVTVYRAKVLAVAPIFFSSLRNRSRANLSYAPWRGCTKPGILTWRATLCVAPGDGSAVRPSLYTASAAAAPAPMKRPSSTVGERLRYDARRMRVFSVEPDGGFTEYEQLPFENDHAEADLEQWLESNPGGILEDGPLLIIGRQVPTDLGKSIDLLGVDRGGNVVVVELKRDRTPRDVVAQALEYAAFAAGLDAAALESILGEYRPDEPLSLAEHHREYFDQSEAVAFNKDQRIVIVGQQVTPEIRQTARFLGDKGIAVTCVEFSFFQAGGGGRLLSQEIVVGGEHAKPSATGKSRKVTKAEFLESCDEHGRVVFARILDLEDHKGISVRWGIKGFSMGVEASGTRVVICYVFPPGTFQSALYDRAGIEKKTAAPAEAIEYLRKGAEQTGLFVPAGKELKCLIDRAFTDDEVGALVAWCESVEQAIREHAVPDGQPPG